MNRGGNQVPIGIPLFKGVADGVFQYFGLKYSGMIERQAINTLLANVNLMIEYFDGFESTNILVIAEHLLQQGFANLPHAYVARMPDWTYDWEIVNPGQTAILHTTN